MGFSLSRTAAHHHRIPLERSAASNQSVVYSLFAPAPQRASRSIWRDSRRQDQSLLHYGTSVGQCYDTGPVLRLGNVQREDRVCQPVRRHSYLRLYEPALNILLAGKLRTTCQPCTTKLQYVSQRAPAAPALEASLILESVYLTVPATDSSSLCTCRAHSTPLAFAERWKDEAQLLRAYPSNPSCI